MVEEFESIEKLAEEIKNKFDSSNSNKKIITLYAFNATGKTRLANIFNEEDSKEEIEDTYIKSLCYSAFLEDIFKWDNDNYILLFDKNDWIIKFIKDQGLANKIIDCFKDITNSKIEPVFDFSSGEVYFKIASGDEQNESNIKISRGEESILIWSIFYTVLETVMDVLNEDESTRSTQEFNNLKYIIIDDPVSSIDDTKIISIAVRLSYIIDCCENTNINFLITTHHALFYNVIFNSLKKEGYILSRHEKILRLEKQKGDSPFGYHLLLKETIKNAIVGNKIEKYHFNLFRNLLEKTANFLGIEYWGDCVSGDKRDEFLRKINLYSHSKLSDIEPKDLSNEDKEIFKQTFDTFIKKYFHE